MSEVLLEKPVFDALNSLLKDHSKDKALALHMEPCSWTLSERVPLNELSHMEFAAALVNGYRLKPTPEEELKELIKDCIHKGFCRNPEVTDINSYIRGLHDASIIMGVNPADSKPLIFT